MSGFGTSIPWRENAPKAALFAGLCLATAATEGIGLLLLVPMIGALAPAGGTLASSSWSPVANWSLSALLALFTSLVLVRGLIVLGRGLAAHTFEMAVVDSLRRRAWRALLEAEWRFLAQTRRSESVSTLISNVDRVGYGLNQLFAGLSGATVLVGLGAATFALSPIAALGGALGGFLILIAYRGLRRKAAYLGEQLGMAYARLYAAFGDALAAVRAIKSQGAEHAAQMVARESMHALRAAQRRYLWSHGLGQLALQSCGALAIALLIWLAVARWHMGLALVLPLIALFVRALPLLGALQECWQHWSHCRPALEAIRALIADAEANRELSGEGIDSPDLQDAIELELVSLRYPGSDRTILTELSLRIPARGLIALEGPSGAGKSTLADLAGGLISPDSGTVRVDRTVLEGAVRQAWRRQVAYVQQDPVVLAASVRENLVWGLPGIGEAELSAALGEASADFVHGLPRGLDTPIGDGGRALSGGERQRLMLARALLRQPALLILDEATSALDPANEAAIAQVLARLKQRMAILVIAHRGALTDKADQVVTLEAGRIVAISGMNAGR